jgi:hypothetical protein
MLKGKCPKCGKIYYGYGLRSPRNQVCGICGVGLKITDGSGETITGYSPFYARKYKIPQSTETPESQEVKEAQGSEDGE